MRMNVHERKPDFSNKQSLFSASGVWTLAGPQKALRSSVEPVHVSSKWDSVPTMSVLHFACYVLLVFLPCPQCCTLRLEATSIIGLVHLQSV